MEQKPIKMGNIKKITSNFKKAFSLVELMVTLIVVSCLIAALAPVITKKLKSTQVTVSSGGNSAQEVISMMCANMFGDANCVQCTKDNCIKCSNEYFLTPEYQCSSCNVGYFCDGTSSTMPCADKFGEGCTSCNSTKCLVSESGYFINNDGYSILCSSQYDPNCALCNATKCNACKEGYAFAEDGITCNVSCSAGSVDFTVAGEYDFETPNGCSSLIVTLVSGGAGGAGGSLEKVTETFSATTSNWTVPDILKGRTFILYAIGGGGGAGGNPEQEMAGNGGAGGMVNGAVGTFTTNSTVDVYVGAGGARGSVDWAGKGGGASYLSSHSSNASLVAGGGGGGGSWYNAGGAGGGASTSNGGSGGYKCPTDYKNAGSGGAGKPTMSTDSRNSVFGSSVTYGNGGTRGSSHQTLGTAGNVGIVWIRYAGEKVGGSGGSGGFIVPKQKINVSSAGETLKVVVGAGGAGGSAATFLNTAELFSQGSAGSLGGQSKILRGATPLLQTAFSDGTRGSGGNIDGSATSSAYSTNGLNTTEIEVENFISNGSVATTTTSGGAGGSTLIDGAQFCQGGSGNSSGDGYSPSVNFGGCGGGGGSAGFSGGKGADGYVRIEWGN